LVKDLISRLFYILYFYSYYCSWFFCCSAFQEFSGVVGLADSMDLETDMSKVPARTVEILASCHALVFVDNKLVWFLN